MKLVWNAIVRNESKVIERCVRSLLPHIDGAIVVDTGSSDGTDTILSELFAAAGKPCELYRAPFVNFEQARNEALRLARASELPWDYLLLADADMELRVHKPDWINGETGLSYDLKQTAGALGYWNRRLVHRSATGWYIGCTHEYLDVATAGTLDGAEFLDHADGSNRPDKLKRDIALLEEALMTETREGLIQRFNFYLAQSFFDLGNWSKAARHYSRRAVMGGYDEEVWYAQYRYALCLGRMDDHAGFIREMLRAYQLRPSRPESLYELAKHFRERSENHASLLFSEPGLSVAYPAADHLFVDDRICKSGLKEEFAICAYYDPAYRARGAVVCDELALRGSRQARHNQYWYLQPLVQHVPSFRPTRIEFPVSEGWVVTNPSVINVNGRATAILRTVNYRITSDGQYAILGGDGTVGPGHPIRTRNYLVRFSRTLKIDAALELALPVNWPEPKYNLVRGFEDSRLFQWGGQLWTLSTVRELTEEGWCEQVLAPVDTGYGYGNKWEVIHPKERRHEKNFAPWVRDKGRLLFVYRPGILMDIGGNIVARHECELDFGHVSGGSQIIEADGLYLAVVHEANAIPGRPHNRFYQHRFIQYDENGAVIGVSPPFVLFDKQIEFVAGLAYFSVTRRLMLSFGVRDCEAWLATVDLLEVLHFMDGGWKA